MEITVKFVDYGNEISVRNLVSGNEISVRNLVSGIEISVRPAAEKQATSLYQTRSVRVRNMFTVQPRMQNSSKYVS